MESAKYYNPFEPPTYEEATSPVPIVYEEYAPPLEINNRESTIVQEPVQNLNFATVSLIDSFNEIQSNSATPTAPLLEELNQSSISISEIGRCLQQNFNNNISTEELIRIIQSLSNSFDDAEIDFIIRDFYTSPNTNTAFENLSWNIYRTNPESFWINNLGNHPTQVECPVCRRIVTTKVKKRCSDKAYMLSFLMCYSLLFAICGIIPLLMDSLKNKKHYCPNCKNCIGKTIVS